MRLASHKLPIKTRFIERYELQPIDAQTNGPQLLFGLRYHTHIVRPDDVETFHDSDGLTGIDFPQQRDASADKIALLRRAAAQHAVDTFADQIDIAIRLAQIELDIGIFREELRQGWHDEAPSLGAMHIHMQRAPGLAAAESGEH